MCAEFSFHGGPSFVYSIYAAALTVLAQLPAKHHSLYARTCSNAISTINDALPQSKPGATQLSVAISGQICQLICTEIHKAATVDYLTLNEHGTMIDVIAPLKHLTLYFD